MNKLNTEDALTKYDDYLRYGTDEEAPKSDRSRRDYLWTAKLFLNFLDGRSLTPELGKAFIRELEAKGNSPSSINRHIWALKSFYRFRRKKLNIRGFKAQSKLPRVLSPDERDHLLSVAHSRVVDDTISGYGRDRARLGLALIYAYLGGGLRLSEAVRLKIGDVLEEGDGGYLHIIRKGGGEGYVPVEQVVIDAIQGYLGSRDQERVNGYIFPGKNPGDHISPRCAQAIVKEICVRAGLPDVHTHTLRHTLGTDYRRAGVAERDIQDVLGHKNIQTTGIYTTLVKEELKAKLPKRFKPLKDTRQGRLIS